MSCVCVCRISLGGEGNELYPVIVVVVMMLMLMLMMLMCRGRRAVVREVLAVDWLNRGKAAPAAQVHTQTHTQTHRHVQTVAWPSILPSQCMQTPFTPRGSLVQPSVDNYFTWSVFSRDWDEKYHVRVSHEFVLRFLSWEFRCNIASTGGRADRHTSRQTDRQTDRQPKTERSEYILRRCLSYARRRNASVAESAS